MTDTADSLEGIEVVQVGQHCRHCLDGGLKPHNERFVIGPPTAMHAGRLTCCHCEQFVGWLKKSHADFVRMVIRGRDPKSIGQIAVTDEPEEEDND
jgi:hypothetical protein